MKNTSGLPAILAASLLLAACSTNPVTGESDFVLMSESQEISLGRQYSAQIMEEMPAYEHAALTKLVQKVGNRLAAKSHRPGLIYRFTIVDSATVNAFALPGGYIYITRGMLAYLNSEAELAAVLGHEIGHVTARHSVRQHSASTATGLLGAVISATTGVQGIDTLTNMAGTAFVRGYGREHELEADRLGAEYLAKSGYDPKAMLEVVGVLKNQEAFEVATARKEGREANVYHGLFSTHPDNDARSQEVVAAARRHKTGTATRVGRDSYLRALDGLTFGTSAKEGVVRGNNFYHEPLNFSVSFPAGWRIDNRSDRIIATPRSNDGLIQMSLSDLNRRITPRQFMTQRLKLEGIRDGKAFSANGMQGYTALAHSNTPWGMRTVRYVIVYRGNSVYVFAGAAKQKNNSRKYDADILKTASSLHPLTRAEKKLAKEKKLKIIRAPADTRYATLARKSALSNYPEEQLRLLNDQYPRGEPKPSQLLKVVR
jgi:predicted Zn-dependent protease